ncbi:MAG: hypothetical protein JRJ12_14840 [Deltaproteobacteria bacterium]|nr:hypothetical protein [Deltaproteobacteria bacterium]MBW2072577.1 hypothetical protein [Deltaproteobacteria bacterium]
MAERTLNVRIDTRMKQALEVAARKYFSSSSAVVRMAIHEFLQKEGIDWQHLEESQESN